MGSIHKEIRLVLREQILFFLMLTFIEYQGKMKTELLFYTSPNPISLRKAKIVKATIPYSFGLSEWGLVKCTHSP